MICQTSIKMCFCVSAYPYEISFCLFNCHFLFSIFSKSNALTINPGWLAFTVNTWLLNSLYLQNQLASRDTWNLKNNVIFTVYNLSASLTLFLWRKEWRELLEEELDFSVCSALDAFPHKILIMILKTSITISTV